MHLKPILFSVSITQFSPVHITYLRSTIFDFVCNSFNFTIYQSPPESKEKKNTHDICVSWLYFTFSIKTSAIYIKKIQQIIQTLIHLLAHLYTTFIIYGSLIHTIKVLLAEKLIYLCECENKEKATATQKFRISRGTYFILTDYIKRFYWSLWKFCYGADRH